MPIYIAQFSDSHLFADKHGRHHNAPVYANLVRVLKNIKNKSVEQTALSAIFFTGDLSQDHSHESYQRFVEAVKEAKITTPLYYLAGNHDDPILLEQYLVGEPFSASKYIHLSPWQIHLLNSKTTTGAGNVSFNELASLSEHISSDTFHLIMMHHHPVDVGYFIDRHGLENQSQFWQTINAHTSIKGIACGHIHRGITVAANMPQRSVPLFACPATSIQFDPSADTVNALPIGPGYRLFQLNDNGTIDTTVIQLD